MKPSGENIAKLVAGNWIPTALCWMCALATGLLGLLVNLLQMFANMNFRFERLDHCGIFLVGWLAAACCFYSAYRLMRYSGYKSLWFVLIAGGHGRSQFLAILAPICEGVDALIGGIYSPPVKR
jgi:hypothetical protein